MGCGCKKNKTTSVQQPTEITVTTEEVTQQTANLTLTEEQQKTVDEIIAKLNQVSS
jgi:hypothetical protein